MSMANDPGSFVLHFAEDGRWAEVSGTVGSDAAPLCSAVPSVWVLPSLSISRHSPG